jgi:hypothetical protein
MTDEAGSRDMEQYVRDRWNLHFAKLDDLWMPPKFHVRIAIPNMHSSSSTPGISVVRDTEAEAWQAAYAFTVEREKQIADVKEEIAMCQFYAENREKLLNGGYQNMLTERCTKDLAALKRIIGRLESTLAELTKGMKPLAGEAK